MRRVDAIAAEARAVETGHKAVRNSDGTYAVRSATRPELRWIVAHRTTTGEGDVAVIHFACGCESGTYRPGEWVPCWHAALVGRRLEREGQATWSAGTWIPTWTYEPTPDVDVVMRRRAAGVCSRCGRFVTVKPTDVVPEPRPEDHKLECRVAYDDAVERAAAGPRIDLWG